MERCVDGQFQIKMAFLGFTRHILFLGDVGREEKCIGKVVFDDHAAFRNLVGMREVGDLVDGRRNRFERFRGGRSHHAFDIDVCHRISVRECPLSEFRP